MVTTTILALLLAAPAQAGAEREIRSSQAVSQNVQGTASVRIVRGFSLTRATFDLPVAGALKRKSWLTDRDGTRRPVDLIEFE